MGLDLLHGVVVKEPFATIRTFVEFQIRNRVGLPLECVSPISPDPLDSAAAAGGASSDFDEWFSHALFGPLRGVPEITFNSKVVLRTG